MDNVMDQENTFSYKYSAKENEEIQEIRRRYKKMEKNNQEFVAEKIRTQYTEKENTQLDELKKLDAKVKRPVNVFAYVFGSISAIIMGGGMSLVMTDIGEKIGMESTMMPGILIGVVGMLLAIVNYPMYKKLLDSRKKKYAEQILKLSESILK